MESKPQDRAISVQALRDIVEGTAHETGAEFFAALVKHLAAAMGTRYAWVTEYLADVRKLRALSFWMGDGYREEYEYQIDGTPCEPVIDNNDLLVVPDRVVELFSEDPDLKPMGAVSYMGVPLRDTDGRILGHLAIMHNQPIDENERSVSVFHIFAARAAAELRRLRRDQALRERERALTVLFENTFDAIIELDVDQCITRINLRGEKLLGIAQENALGRAFDVFLTKPARTQLRTLIKRLESRPDGQQSCWVPEGFRAVRAGGVEFPADASLSRFELDGRPFYTLILRDANERLEAEQRIQTLTDEAARLRQQIDTLQGFETIVGESDALRKVLADVQKVAGGDTTVLITGETGTGKELIARAVHSHSHRKSRPIVTVNCAAIPANLQESEFFGHEKGAFTGATQRREGRFKLADGGTIFLDEVGELPLDLQAKLLRVLQEGEYEPIGSSRTEKVDVRVIAATNRDLEAMVEQETFRKDLLYRLNVFPLHVPPLRDRGQDIVLLAETFVRRFAKRRGGRVAQLSEDAKAKLLRYDWPGNVRELENVIERAIITSGDRNTLQLDRALPETPAMQGPRGAAPTSPETSRSILTETELRDLERQNILRALEECGWKISGAAGAAERLGLRATTLSSRMKSLGIERP